MHGQSLGHVNRLSGVIKKSFTCIFCGNTKSLKSSDEPNKQFCSKKCEKLYTWETEGVINVILGNGTPGDIRQYFKVENLYFCDCCKISKWQNKDIDLKIFHRDGNISNKAIDNIGLLCPNCYSVS
jgi:hypothetical protein